MNILFLSHTPNNPNAGASRIYHRLTEDLRARGHSVSTWHLEDYRLPRSRWLRLLVQRVLMPQWISWHVARADLSQYDVIMSSSGMAHPLFDRLRSLKPRPLLVNHLHGLFVYDHIANLTASELGYWKASWLYRLFTGPFQVRWDAAGIRSGDLTITQNLRDLAWVKDNQPPDADTLLIPCAVHPRLLKASDTWRPLKERRPSNILWFASWEARKGAHLVPAAFRKVRQKYSEATLTIGGSGKLASEVLGDFAVEDRASVKVLPSISIEEQIELFNECAIFLFPSLSEGFGLALPEAMCFGLAAVTTQTGFGADYLTDGLNAAVVYPSTHHLAEALLDLIEHDDLRYRLGAAGRDLARTFTPQNFTSAYERAFADTRPAPAREKV